MKRSLLSLALMLLTITACSDSSGPHTRGVYMLLDTSGTYASELKKAQHIINYTLAKLNPGDSFAVARVDTGSFSEKDIIVKMTFDDRPSIANQQKRKFRDRIDHFVKGVQPSRYTDITGGILQAVEYLNEMHTGRNTVLIFSDLKEEIKKGFIRDIPLQVNGFEVVALNVTKLRSDNIDPRKYMNRLKAWKSRIESGAGTWRVVNDLERLDSLLSN